MQEKIDVLITDLDNTLWDWLKAWHAMFTALVDVLVDEARLDRQRLLDEAGEIHQRQRTSEYSRLLQELPSAKDLQATSEGRLVFEHAIEAAQAARERELCLYPGVFDTLAELRDAGTLIVAYTESMAFATSQRIRKLNLDGVIDWLYSSPDHDFPAGISPREQRRHDDGYYDLKRTRHRHVERGVTKPNARVLMKIMADVGARRRGTVYVGDNLMKDIAMAQEAGVNDVLAVYGQNHDGHTYELLRKVTHWRPEDVQREKDIEERCEVQPTHVIDAFPKLMSLFEFGRQEDPQDG